jgi:hypothetical protein
MSDGAPSSAASAPTTSAAPTAAPAASPAPSAPASSPGTSSAASSTPNAPAPATGQQSAPAAPATERKVPVIIDGKRVEMTRREMADYLANDAPEDDVVSTYRLRAAAQARMKEAAEQRKAVEAQIARIKDPEQMMGALIEHHGGNQQAIDAAIEKYYRARLAESEMTPEQRERAKMQAELDRYKSEETKRKEVAAQQRKTQLMQKAASDYRKSFGEAIASAKLPATPATMRRMAAHAEAALAAGVQRSAADIARDVREEMRAEWAELHGGMDDDGMLELLGEERLKRIRARDVERFKAAQAAAVAPVTAPSPPRAPDGKFAPKSQSTRDFFEKLRNG